jgi:amino acid adenylation domain-containing protein
LVTLLAGIVAAPQQRIGALPVLSAAQRQQLLVEWNATQVAVPHDGGLPQRIAAQAARRPDAVAVVCATEHLTYAALDQRANQLAHTLQQHGVAPDQGVALALPRSLELLIGLLGVLKAGGAYVPLDLSYPAERLAFMLADAQVQVLITAAADDGPRTEDERRMQPVGGRPSSFVGQVIDLIADWPQIAQAPVTPPQTRVRAAQLAYVIYTSGSTGRPKGVAITHGALSNLLHALRAALGLTAQDVLLAVTTIAFDIAGLELFLPLLCGARLVLVPRVVARDGPQLAACLAGARATLMQATPATWRLLLDAGWPGAAQLTSLCGGEALPDDLAAALRARSAAVWNLYGPTETTIWSAAARVTEGAVVIGRPLANTQLYLLDAAQQPVAIGVVGEVYIGGTGLARGYHNRPDLTAARFVPNPFLELNDERRTTNDECAPADRPVVVRPSSCVRLYKTGDLARYRADGQIVYLGRRDGQVKLRGYRIELGEIEAALLRHPAVRRAVVALRATAPGAEQLVAYVVPTDDERPPQDAADAQSVVPRPAAFVQALRAFLSKYLPDYMLPAAFVLLDALPLTPNSKVDRQALPAPDRALAAAAYRAPRTPTEEVLADQWAQLLGLARVGRGDNFFDLGGHSLLATQLIARVRMAFAVELPLRTLFEAPTIAELSACIAAARRTTPALPLPPLVPARRGDHAPLSFSQQRLWFLDQLEPGGVAFNMPLALRLTGRLDLMLLQRSLNAVIRRHETLRTRFATVDGQPVQLIAATLPLPLPLLDLRGLSASDHAAQLECRAAAEAERPFDLARGPLLRVGLTRLDAATHVLFLTLHHIIADGWSLSVLMRDLAACYAAARAGRAAALPALPIQYADYAIWQRAALQGALLAEHLAYWRGQLGGALPLLELPTDHPRPAVQTFNGTTQPLIIPSELSAALTAISRHANATLFMTLLAAFQTLLQRYTSQNDLTVGVPIANRDHVETEALIGFFLNTLVLRADLRGDPRFLDLLRQVRARTLDAYAHQQLPFEQLVEELHPPRNLRYPPLFQVMFILQNVPSPDLAATELTIEALPLTSPSAKYDLTLSLTETSQGLTGGLEYNTDLFDPPTITRLIGHFQMLLAGIVADPDQRLGALPLLAAAERQQLLIEWTATQRTYPSLSLPSLFAAQVAYTPDAVALRFERPQPLGVGGAFGAEQLTYHELGRRANQLAQHLRTLGVGPEVRVGICLDRSPELVVALLGVLMAGGVYVPLDPSYPAARLAFMQTDAQIAVLITAPGDQDTEITTLLVSTSVCRKVVDLHTDWPQIAQLSATPPSLVSDADALAYVIYTSGSTGAPKGVAVAQRQLLNRFQWMWQTYPFAPGEVGGQKTALNFVDSLWELLGPLLQGCPSVIIPMAVLRDLSQLVAHLARHDISRLWLVPSLLAALLDSVPDLAARLPRLTVWVSSGEALAPDLRQRFQERMPNSVLLNLYGTSEVFDATLYDPRLATAGAVVPIGRPIANVQTYVLDAQLRPVPIGVVGELYVGGVGLARGYLGRPDLTAAHFGPNPFGDCRLPIADCRLDDPTSGYRQSASGYRLYRTGDQARYQADGQIVYLGRRDQQLKLRGFRIEPAEIEAALRAHPQVRAAAVLACAAPAGEQRLVAYVVTAKDERRTANDEGADSSFVPRPSSSVQELRSFLRTRLPEVMVPATYLVLDALPLTPSGKLDRQALPAPAESATSAAYVAPRTPTEEIVADQWAQLLGLARVGRDANFFDQGGHSLLATQVIARIRDAFAVELPLRALFDAPTIAGIAEQIAAARHAPPELLPPLVPAAHDGPVPLSFAQQRLWFLDQLVPGSPFYNIPIALRLIGQPNLRAFADALAAVVRRHETLRTTFAEVGGRPMQVIAPTQAIALPLIDLRALPATIYEAAAVQLATAEAQRPFNLAVGPLIRVALLRLSAHEQILLVTLHHSIADGWSLGVLIQELATLYAAAAAGQPAALPALPIQYADYALWQRTWLIAAGADRPSPLQSQLAYWTTQLADLPLLDLPTDLPRPATPTFRGATQTIVLAPELSVALGSLGQRAGATLFMTLLACFQVLLARYSGQDDIAVGAPIAGRRHAETEGLIGFFVNTLVLRGDLSADPTFHTLLGRVREMTLAAYAHQDVPFEVLVDALQPERDLSRTPLFQVMFVLQNTPLPTLELRDLTLAPVALDAGIAAFELKLVVAEGAAGLLIGLEYSTDLFTAATITRLLGHYRMLLAGIVADSSRRVAALPLLTDAERQQLLVEWNSTQTRPRNTEHGTAEAGCIHQLFAAQVTRTPDVVALTYGAQQLTYAELDRRANQLAQHLRALGVGPELRVGIAMARSPELVIALLGTLKAGGAYVPLDPSYPPDRLTFMLSDAQAQVLLTQTSLDEGGTGTIDRAPTNIGTLGGARSPALPVTQTVVDLRSDWRMIAQLPTTPPPCGSAPDQLAYVIYTSGSTGTPKGVAIAHRSAVALIAWAQTVFTTAQLARVLAATSISFDLSIFELFVPLSSGGTVILVDDVLQLPELSGADVTLINTVPSAMAELLRLDGLPPSVQVVNLAGEALPPRLVEQLYRRPSVQRVFNLYGPSEDTTYSTAALLARDAAPTIGRPIANTQAYVLDRQRQPVPIGVPGELYLAGAGLARGYLNRPALTAERFVPNPFETLNAERRTLNGETMSATSFSVQRSAFRLYKTGDLARYRSDGAIEFLGRFDHQVKLRGYRIELGEIAAVLERHPAVRACAVLARVDSPGDQRLVAYVVPTDDESRKRQDQEHDPSFVSDLRTFLSERLPDPMIPAAFVLLDALPLNANGKLNRAALPAPEHTRSALAAAFVAPRTPVETVIAGIWVRVLGLGLVGIDDNFFALGGHSLLATQVVAQLRDSFQVALPVRRVFETPTVAGLATVLLADPRQRRRVERTAELLIQLSQLSEDDVDSLIAERTGVR